MRVLVFWGDKGAWPHYYQMYPLCLLIHNKWNVRCEKPRMFLAWASLHALWLNTTSSVCDCYFLIIMYLLSPQPTSSNPQHQVEPAANEWIYPKGYQRPFNAASIKHGRTLVSRDFRNYYKICLGNIFELLHLFGVELQKVVVLVVVRTGKGHRGFSFLGRSHKRQFHARAQTCFCMK